MEPKSVLGRIEMLLVYDLARTLAGRLTLSEAAEIAFKHFRLLIPATTCVFYVYDARTNELAAVHVAGTQRHHTFRTFGFRWAFG